ncbi:DET1 protein [Aphelenchoides avenae]|nr:DET1 protein [Aphelenchus avenae]
MKRSVHFIERPHFYAMRFTPDGTKLTGVALSQHDIVVFRFRGTVYGMDPSVMTLHLFNALFTQQFSISLNVWNSQSNRLPALGQISKDCMLVTADSRHLIVAATVAINEINGRLQLLQRNNESLMSTGALDDVRFYSIDLKKGQLCDSIRFDYDYINIPQGTYLVDRVFAVLSVQHQTVHMYQIDRVGGAFVPLMQIGRCLLDDDNLYVDAGAIATQSAMNEKFFTGFRQHFLTFVFNEYKRRGMAEAFLRNITQYRMLKMYRIQMVGPEILLIRLEHRVKKLEPGSHCMFVMFEWRAGRIVGVFHRSSAMLFKLYEIFNEDFRNGNLVDNGFPTSSQYCGAAKQQHENLKSSMAASMTESEIHRRFLSPLPLNLFTVPMVSPYLDPQLFNIDERVWSHIERGRYPSDTPLRIFSRRTGRLHCDLDIDSPRAPPNTLVATKVLFHPVEPFAVSFDKHRYDAPMSFYLPRACSYTGEA